MMNEILSMNRYITVKEAALYLSLNRGSIYNLVSKGKLKAYKVGNVNKGSLRFTLRDLDAFVGKESDNQKIK